MKILVVVASYGERNRAHLQRLLQEYRSMPFEIRLMVLTDKVKNLGRDVEEITWRSGPHPKALPFSHKQIFAEHAGEFDLFIYSEDDTLITERSVRSFVRAAEALPPKYIPGFLRFECSPEGRTIYTTIHGAFHWQPDFLLRAADFTFARYTNDHSGCCVLTRLQLEAALKSGGFLKGFRKTRYDYLETAATDAYTQCGMTKVIPISHLADFSLHHLPNIYWPTLGIPKEMAELELAALLARNGNGEHNGPLFPVETKLNDALFDKIYYESAREDILAVVPEGAKRILSVGCGSGETEQELMARGAEVTGIPMDSVVAVSARNRGVKLVSPDIRLARQELTAKRFDCILWCDTLHRFENPVEVMKDFNELLSPGGWVVVSAPNFKCISTWPFRRFAPLYWSEAQAFTTYGLHFTSCRKLKNWLAAAGLSVAESELRVSPRFNAIDRLTLGQAKKWLAHDLVFVGQKPNAGSPATAGRDRELIHGI